MVTPFFFWVLIELFMTYQLRLVSISEFRYSLMQVWLDQAGCYIKPGRRSNDCMSRLKWIVMATSGTAVFVGGWLVGSTQVLSLKPRALS